MTLDEWVERSAGFLAQNLKANIDVYCPSMSEEDKEDFLRMNMIMVRQFSEPNNGEAALRRRPKTNAQQATNTKERV